MDLELPSDVDDIMASIIDWDGRRDISQVLVQANFIILEVAIIWKLPLKEGKTEKIILKKKKKRDKPAYMK